MLLVSIFLLFHCLSAEVTTILLIDNDGGFGKAGKPAGLLTSTARTFVNEGATTEYATQIVGTTLENGRLYAQILQTSSRVYYGDQKYKPGKNSIDSFIKPSEPVFIFPTKVLDVNMNLLKPVKEEVPAELLKSTGEELFSGQNVQFSPAMAKDDEKELLENVIRARKVDVFNKRNVEGIKASKVTQSNLPTFTVKHDFAPSGFSVTPNEGEKEEKKEEKSKLRLGKGLFVKPTQTKFDTVTYVGFADFTTTVGNTVIIFMPHTKSSSEATLEPATTKSQDPKVMTSVKTFMSHSPGMVTKTVPGHSLTMQTALPTLVADRKSKAFGEDHEVRSSYLAKEQDQFVNPVSPTQLEPSSDTSIEPSEATVHSSMSTNSQPTEPLATYATTVTRSFNQGGAEKPLGLLKSIGGTKAYNGTTTHFTSLIYGTFVGKSYTQILQTSSNSFYLTESNGKKSTVFLQSPTTTPEPSTDHTEEDEELLTTGDDVPFTTEGSMETSAPENEETEPNLEPTDEAVTRLVPSTVYKTFTYLTTFFIPADETLTTTSIRSREVVTSDITYVTKVIDDTWLATDIAAVIEPTEVNLIENTEGVDAEFQLPAVRILAPEEVITTTEKAPEEEKSTLPVGTEPPTTLKTTPTTTSTTTEETSEDVSTSSEPSTSTSTTSTTTETTTNEITTEGKILTTPSDNQSGDEEIEVVYKTLYTTYTYLTTFFQESTTSVSSREEVVTNIVTSTLSTETIEPTSVTEEVETSRTTTSEVPENSIEVSSLETYFTTYTYFTTLFDEGSTSIISRTEVVSNIVPTPTVSVLPSSILQNEDLLKSKFEMLLREQQGLKASQSTEKETTEAPITTTTTEEAPTIPPAESTTPNIRPTGVLKRTKYGTIARKLKRPIKLSSSESTDETYTPATTPKLEKPGRTVVRKRLRTKSRLLPKSTTIIDEKAGVTTIHLDPAFPEDDKLVRETMITDVTTSTSKGNRQVKRIAPPEPIEKIDKVDVIYEDQISSESNNEEIQPSASATLLLQTSFTTFTYFTTVYKGSSSSDIISRLETVTNVVTETVTPDALLVPSLSPEDATLPITYFTTFTYWTTLYRDGNTVVTSREETVSNVVTPSIEPTTTSGIEPTTSATLETKSIEQPVAPSVFVPGFVPEEPTTLAQEPETTSPISTKPIEDVTEPIILKDGIDDKLEPTTYYTTYTYFTTSYIGDSTVVKSRLETVTNVVNTTTPAVAEVDGNDLQTGRAISPGNANKIEPSSSESLKTGLLSTVVSSDVNEGKTTLYSTDIFATYIDGLYAKVLESTTKVLSESETTPVSATEAQKTGIVSINEGKIVDADGISTTFFTTKAIGTSIEQLYAQVVESTSSVLVDNDKKSALASIQPGGTDIFKTGLVRLIEGSIIKDDTTTLYESRVIGTVIDGRYAQIIESTSSYKIAPTETVSTLVKPTVGATLTTPSPSTIQSSMADDDSNDEDSENEEGEEEDDDDEGEDGKGKGRVRSRLSFQQRKKTFTPVIRPFASRNRPTFLPKKKTVGVSSAQTVTRSNFTPTITATLATKSDGVIGASRNRFSGRRSSSSAVEVKPTATSSSRRFSGRGRSSTISSPVSSSPSSRGRGSSRISATPSLNLSSTRSRGSFRSSSSRALQSSESPRSSLLPARPRVRPTLSGLPGRGYSSSTTPQPPPRESTPDPSDLEADYDAETEGEEEEEPVVTTTTTTTEDPNFARRNGNPLLRFRRPPVPRVSTTTPKPDTTPTPRRGVLNNNRNKQRATTTTPAPSTTTKSSRTRPASSFGNRAQLPNRARPVNNLFPPRGLLKKPAQEEEKPENGDEEEIEEYEDEGEDSNVQETAPQKTESSNNDRRVQIRRFDAQRRSLRVRRQTEYGSRSRNTNSRYRRPPSRAQERYDYYDDEPISTEAPRTTPRGRTRSRQNTQAVQTTAAPRIRPSSSLTQRAQFTLREKDTTTANPRNTNFRRTQATTPRRRTSNYRTTEPSPSVRKPSRLRPQTVVPSTQRRGFTNQRRPTTTRVRGRFGEDESLTLQPAFDGTITVTHKIPSEVTIPFVTGKVTEYRNVITAKPSIEVLGPHQYMVTSTNGGTLLFLNSEFTSTLPNGATEVTRFLVHETPTTTVTFTPTTIRGRKTSFAHVLPSTVYEVENLVTTLQPSLSSPLANILLSQLLLGNLNIPQNMQQQSGAPTPTTEYKTKTTTYVTSVTEQLSTILPLTFRGKEILTTILDSSVNVITATEYITETIVITPTVTPANQINSLLLPALLQAQLLNPPTAPPALPGLPQLNLDALRLDDKSKNNALRESEENLEEEKEEIVDQPRFKPRKRVTAEPAKEVVTLYVSGRRPGEFSTVLSTVVGGDSSVRKREALLDDIERLLVEASEVKQVRVLASQLPSLDDVSIIENVEIAPGMSEVFIPVSSSEMFAETQSLESVVGDITLRPTDFSSPPSSATRPVVTKVTKKPSNLSKLPQKRDS